MLLPGESILSSEIPLVGIAGMGGKGAMIGRGRFETPGKAGIGG